MYKTSKERAHICIVVLDFSSTKLRTVERTMKSDVESDTFKAYQTQALQ